MKRDKRTRICAWLIIFVIISQMILPQGTLAVAAESQKEAGSVVENGDFSIQGTDSFGNMLSQTLSDEVEQQEENQGCNIFEITIEEQKAAVSLETSENATLVVGIYSEDGLEMKGSGIAEVTPDDEEITVDIATDGMPEYFLVRGFLINSEDYSPLCTAYESSMYTQEMKKLLDLTVDDFDADRVLNLDESKDNNFAIYKENVQKIEIGNEKNHIVSEDKESYVIENADETVRNLEPGDFFAGVKEDGETIIVKVKAVTKDGTKVTVVQDDTGLDEVFDYVKIDTEAGLDSAQIDNSYCDDGVIYNGLVEEQDDIQTYAIIDGDASEKLEASYSIPDKKIKAGMNTITLSGGVKMSVEAAVKLYIALDRQTIEIELKYNAKITAGVNGKLDDTEVKLGQFTIAPVPGVFIEFIPKLVLEFTASITLTGTLDGSIGLKYTDDSGIQNISKTPSFQSELNIEGSFYVGFALEPKIVIISEKIATAGIEAKIGAWLHAQMNVDLTGTKDESKKHSCKECIKGNLYGQFDITFSIKLLNNKKLSKEKTFSKKSKEQKFYYSITYKEFGFGECPHVETKVSAVSLGITHNAVITGNGDLYLWGKNYFGELGTGNYISSDRVPVKIMEHVVETGLGLCLSAAITENGDLYTWGFNDKGQLGNSGIQDSNVPVKIMEHVKKVSIGYRNGAAITENGELYLWGFNSRGQIGDGSTTNSNVPVKIMEHVKEVNLGDWHSAAITEDGELYLWGDNQYGELGDGSTIDSNVPKKVMEHVKEVNLGDMHSAAITEDGELYMWGYNAKGELGDGSTIDSNVPKKIMEHVKEVNLGSWHSAAITEDGELYMWGENARGELGDGSTIDSNVPKKIMEHVKEVNLGNWHSAAITEDGELYMWGYNVDERTTVPGKVTINEVSAVNEYAYESPNLLESYAINSSEVGYKDLKSGRAYVFYVLKSESMEKPLTTDNLLYMAQGTADADGKLSFSYSVSGSYKDMVEKISSYGKYDTGEAVTISGDIDGNGKVNLQDSALLRRYLAGWDVTIDENAADVDGNGKVNLQDSALLRRYLAGWDVTLK